MDSDSHDPVFEDGDNLEISSHTFVVRVWLEEISRSGRTSRWRGRVTHALSGNTAHFENFEALRSFILPYLQNW